jgi:hypothetical protein
MGAFARCTEAKPSICEKACGTFGAQRACMKKSISSLLFVLLVAGLAAGCAASGSARYSASVTTPRLIYVSAGVQVIEDYDEPIFYSSNMYWRYDGGVWYQSRYHTTGWIRVSNPPAPILRIERPAMYVHYRGSANASATGQARAEEKREMKEEKREAQDEKREAQQEKREDKQEKREDKQDAKEAQKPGNDSHKPSKK